MLTWDEARKAKLEARALEVIHIYIHLPLRTSIYE